MYPAFVNCTTIDWFSEWPQDALLEVAEKYLESMDLGDEEVRNFAWLMFMFCCQMPTNIQLNWIERFYGAQQNK